MRLVHGEALEFLRSLPDASVDAVVTDPPYGLGESSLRWEEKRYQRISEEWDGEVPTAWAKEAARVLKPGGSCIWFAVWKTLEVPLLAIAGAGLTRRAIVVWDKYNTMPNVTARGYQFTHEFAIWATKGGRYYWGSEGQTRDILRHPWQEQGREHPAQKTVPLMRELVRLHCPPGSVCLDPFMGSGTTGVACVREGRDFIGVEQDAHYFAVAQRRIAEAEAHRDGTAGELFACLKGGA